MEDEPREVCYLFEGGERPVEIPGPYIRRIRLGDASPAQTESSLLVKTIESEE